MGMLVYSPDLCAGWCGRGSGLVAWRLPHAWSP